MLHHFREIATVVVCVAVGLLLVFHDVKEMFGFAERKVEPPPRKKFQGSAATWVK